MTDRRAEDTRRNHDATQRGATRRHAVVIYLPIEFQTSPRGRALSRDKWRVINTSPLCERAEEPAG